METLMSQTCFDGVDRFFYAHNQPQQQQPQQTDLPVLGAKALEQILFAAAAEPQQASQIAPCTPEMERMSPDSSMDWAQNGEKMIPTPTSSPTSTSTLPLPQPDSTTSDSVTAYDSDAFNSDDSNDSCAEMQLNTHLLNNPAFVLNQQHVDHHQPQNEDDDKSNNNFLNKLQTVKVDDAQPVKEKRKKKKGKRAGNVLLQCQLCEYSTRFKEHLTSHMNTHTNTRKYSCPDCAQTFKWSHSLRRHQRTHRRDRSDFAYVCGYCEKTFSRKDHLKIHENLHRSSNESHPCPECNATFKNKKTLAGHMKTHNAEKAFKCEECSSEFTRRASLNRHMEHHHKGKKYVCNLCPVERTFSYRSTLEEHKKSAHNDGRRDYKCDLCNCSFAVKAYLTKHMVTCRNKQEGLSFACQFCKKSFPTKRHLNEHCKRKHGEPKEKGDEKSTVTMTSTPPPPPPQYPFHQQQQPLPAFQPHYHHDLCQQTPFSNEFSLPVSNASTTPLPTPTPPTTVNVVVNEPQVVTGADLPLPQIGGETGEENVGSLMRQLYDNDQHFSYHHHQHQQQQHHLDLHPHHHQRSVVHMPQQQQHSSESLMEYPILEGLPIDCL